MSYLRHPKHVINSRRKNSSNPLSPGQYDLWLEQQLYPEDSSNHFHFVAKIHEEMDLDALQKAIWHLAERHEAIRTIFSVDNEVPARQIIQPTQIKLQIQESLHLSEEEVKSLIQKNFKKPFNLSYETPCRFFLYQRSALEYYFQIVEHHIVTTLNGYAHLPIELARLYISERDKRQPDLFEQEISYSNFVDKYQKYLKSNKCKIDKDYWLHYLSGNLPNPLLPLHQTSDLPNFSNEVYHCEVNEELVTNLCKIARSNNSTLFSLLTAAFQVLQSRYTKAEEIIIGIPTDVKRKIAGKESCKGFVGYTINTLPLRSKILFEQEFARFAAKVSEDIRNMSEHRLYPISMILDDLRKEKGNKNDKLFTALVVSQKAEESEELCLFGIGKLGIATTIDGLKYESIGVGHLPTGRFDLVLAIVETSNALILSFHYNSSIFKEFEIKNIANNYLKLLTNIAYDPYKKIGELAVVSDEEQHLQLNIWNCISSDIENQGSFLKHFEEKAASNSKAVAVVFEETEITYGMLNRLANQLARYLQKLGVTEKTLVGIGIERSPQLIISLLGVIKAGGAYLTLDPEHPKDRVHFMLEDSEVEILLTQRSLQKTFSAYLGKTVLIDKDWDKISKEDVENLSINVDSGQLAYVIYTSGSTGKPKGVEIAKKSLDNLLTSMQEHLNLSTLDRWLASTTFSFDISNLEVLLPLRQGAVVVLASQQMVKDPALLARVFENQKITFAQATPSTWQMLVDFGWNGSQKLTILCGGEALSQALAEKLILLSGSLWNMYGPTETTIWSSMKKIEDPKEKITIGRPIKNTTFYILDENRNVQPLGVPGELYIGGVGLAKGYRRNTALSQERFIVSNFPGTFCSRLYRTGDLVRYLPNGEIECLGRIDQQVKIRGYRIELGEIEETLKKCKGIQQAVAVVREDKFGDKRIFAYCIGDYQEQQIRQIMSSQLPHYMLPAAYVHLDKLPITPNGKIDRKALPAPKYGLDNVDYLAPRNPIEKEVARIFENLLDLEKVSVNASFFSLGGHSLLAARAITNINKIFHVRLPLKTILEKSTAILVAKEVETALRGYECSSIYKAPTTKAFGLSHPQQRFWFLEQQTKNNAAYIVPFLIELIGDLDIACLRQAVNEIVERHEILRTIFREGSENPEQISLPDIKPSILYEEFSSEKDAKAFVLAEAKKPFDLTQGPLFRFILLKLPQNRHLFFSSFHHIVFDGYSINVFIEELKALYIGYMEGKTQVLPHLPIQYVDYVHWQNTSFEKTPEENQTSWWVEKLQDAPFILNLPADKQRPPIQTHNGALLEFLILDHSDLSDLKKLAQEHECTIFIVLLAVFHVLLYRYTGQNDLIIGIPVSGRSHNDLNSLIGCFINTLALRTTSSSKDTFSDFLRWIKIKTFEAFKNQDVPFEKVIEKLKIERSLSHSLLFQVMFNMLPQTEISEIHDLQVRIKNVDRKMAHLDLSLSVQESEKRLIGVFEYNTDLFFKSTIKRMSKHFQRVLKAVIRNPEEKICKLPLLSESEIHRQAVQWNEQSIIYPKNENIIQLIEKWAECLPNAVAIVCKGKNYSYCEINTKANKIAHTLINSGMQSEDRIPVCFERSADFISTILGILKAGGIYIPLYPAAPNERIESILKELQPFRVLTHSSLEHRFLGFDTQCIDKLELDASESDNPRAPISKKQLAYIIYTSGSTGKPKGVEIEHKSINDRVLWKNAAYPLSPSDVILHTYSFIFDGAIINYFWPLCAGASLVIASEEDQLDPAALIQLVIKYKVTTMDLLPSLLQGLLDEQQITYCHSLKNVFSGGEALPTEAIHQFYKKCDAKLRNTYGPTEATVEVSANTLWHMQF